MIKLLLVFIIGFIVGGCYVINWFKKECKTGFLTINKIWYKVTKITKRRNS